MNETLKLEVKIYQESHINYLYLMITLSTNSWQSKNNYDNTMGKLNAFKSWADTNNSRSITLLMHLDHNMTYTNQTKSNHLCDFSKPFCFWDLLTNHSLYNYVKQWLSSYFYYFIYFPSLLNLVAVLVDNCLFFQSLTSAT